MLLLEEAGLDLVEVRPVIDAFTLVAWRALGTPRSSIAVGTRVAALPRDLAARQGARWDHRTVNTAKLT